jgi:hypothetical protein
MSSLSLIFTKIIWIARWSCLRLLLLKVLKTPTPGPDCAKVEAIRKQILSKEDFITWQSKQFAEQKRGRNPAIPMFI